MPIFVSRRARRTTVAWIAALAALFLVGYLLSRLYAPGLADPDRLRAAILELGPWAPVGFVLLQAAQVVVAPVPGQVLGFVGGYLFGALHGTLYSLAGVTLGSAIVFWLARRFGRPYVERVVEPATVARVDGFLHRNAALALFVAFLLPGLPDDAICFVGGLSDLPLWKLVALAVVGRAPGFFLMSIAGAEAATGATATAAALLVVLGGLSIAGYLARDRIAAWLAAGPLGS